MENARNRTAIASHAAVACLAVIISVCHGGRGLLAQAKPGAAQAAEVAPEIVQVRPDLYMIVGGGGNVAVQVGSDGIVCVDTGSTASSKSVLVALSTISKSPIRYVINTSADADHVGGNEAFLQASRAAFDKVANQIPANFLVSGPVAILATENVLRRMSAPTGKASPFSSDAWPTETFETSRRYLYLNGEGIEVLRQPSAHSDGDAIVFFRRSDVIVAGDIFDTTRFPVIDVARGGSVQGTIDALTRIVAMAIPSVPDVSREAGTSVIPGHGHVGDQFDILNYRDMLVIIRDQVQDLIKAGQTLAQVKAASPARGFVNRYGARSGSWTTDDFVESVYRSLAGKKL